MIDEYINPKSLILINYNEKAQFIQLELKVIRYIRHFKKDYISKKHFEKQIPSLTKYIKFLKNNFTKFDYYDYINNPKISFIASVFNKENYLSTLIKSIQLQLLKEFEIIFVDDYSTDKSIEIIEKFQKSDKRIKLFKNKKNMGSLYTRYFGAINAIGEYIIFIDSDDIVLKEGIINAYNHLKKKNLDMVEFHSVFDNVTEIYISTRYYKYKNIIYQPVLSYIFYYDINKGDEQNTALWDKLIRKETVKKSLNYIGEKYFIEKIIIENDVLLLFSLFQNSNSFQYIDELGYYYFIQNNNSISNTKYGPNRADEIIHSIFINIKFLYDNTKETVLDKYFCLFKLDQAYIRYKDFFIYINKEYDLIETVLNKLLISKNISNENKLKIQLIKFELLKNKKN